MLAKRTANGNSTAAAKTARRGSSISRIQARNKVVTSGNDNLSAALENLVPQKYAGTDRYLDVVQWNVEWFGASKSRDRDKRRYALVLQILHALNADLFIFQEVVGPDKRNRCPGVLDGIAAELTKRGAGDYAVEYTDAGGEQRVAMMWDRDWLRAKSDVAGLFAAGAHKMDDGKDAFAGRTPLYGYFAARVPGSGGTAEGFDFQALGVHLKAMAEGKAQRYESARVLADWMCGEAPKVDADVLIMGDWNAPPDDTCWEPICRMEDQGKLKFRAINDPSDFSYLWLANKTSQCVSRIDLTAMSLSSMRQVEGAAAGVVRWKPIEETLAQAGKLTDARMIAIMKEIKEAVSDHMPTVNRFYFTPREAPA